MEIIDFDAANERQEKSNGSTLFTTTQFCRLFHIHPNSFDLLCVDDEAPPIDQRDDNWYISVEDASDWAHSLPFVLVAYIRSFWVECIEAEERRTALQDLPPIPPDLPHVTQDLIRILRQPEPVPQCPKWNEI